MKPSEIKLIGTTLARALFQFIRAARKEAKAKKAFERIRRENEAARPACECGHFKRWHDDVNGHCLQCDCKTFRKAD